MNKNQYVCKTALHVRFRVKQAIMPSIMSKQKFNIFESLDLIGFVYALYECLYLLFGLLLQKVLFCDNDSRMP